MVLRVVYSKSCISTTVFIIMTILMMIFMTIRQGSSWLLQSSSSSSSTSSCSSSSTRLMMRMMNRKSSSQPFPFLLTTTLSSNRNSQHSLIHYHPWQPHEPKQLFSTTTSLSSLSSSSWGDHRTTTSATIATTTTTTNTPLTSSRTDYDVIVVGGGHAGCEAAAAAARMFSGTNYKVALITQRLDTIGELSCNPSIGGIGKGHLVREIDALDGIMGHVADHAGIHYRILNRRKGLAVRGPRAQMDRDLYKSTMQQCLLQDTIYSQHLELVQGTVQDLLLEETILDSNTVMMTQQQQSSSSSSSSSYSSSSPRARIRGVLVQRTHVNHDHNDDDNNPTTKTLLPSTIELTARAVVITTGTFLRGVLMMGKERYAGGRHLRDSEHVEPPSLGLAQTLIKFQFPLDRLKTGTPPRLDGNTIDWDVLTPQPSEDPATPFSHLLQYHQQQPLQLANGKKITCFQTATNERTHQLVMDHEHLLPTYDGLDGKGNGPRYCPSIYKKVQRFSERSSHNCFLEPEGLNTNIVYPNGMSGPYPPEIQLQIMRSMKGLEHVEIVRPGYDVEYDFVNPTCLTHTLETKTIQGLYLAGQICGTTGYEEAAAQGIVAGANAGQSARSLASSVALPPFIIGRDEGYIGVLIDDLVTRGTLEPYRMFTSRAEYRISLRADNADFRLTRKGIEFGLVRNVDRMDALDSRTTMVEDRIHLLKSFSMKVTDWAARGGNDLMGGAQIEKKGSQRKSADEVLAMPDVTLQHVERIIMAVQEQQQQENNNENEQVSEDVSTENDHNDSITRMLAPSPPSIYDTVEASIKYQHYSIRQHRDMESWRRAQGVRIPPDLIYDHQSFPSLAQEELEKLNQVRPTTFAQASQISGVTPNGLFTLFNFIQRRNREREQQQITADAYDAEETIQSQQLRNETPKQIRKKLAQAAVAAKASVALDAE